jgi:hypothetical protein
MGLSFQYAIYITLAIFYFGLSLPNPIYVSTNPIFGNASVHPLSWVFVFLFALYVRIRLPVLSNKVGVAIYSKYHVYLQWFYNATISVLLVCFAMGFTEFVWDLSMTYYWFSHGELVGIGVGDFILTWAFFLTGSAILINIGLRNYKYFRHIWLIPLTMGIFQIIWISMGFPLTSFVGSAHNLLANIFEETHWGLGIGIFGILYQVIKE